MSKSAERIQKASQGRWHWRWDLKEGEHLPRRPANTSTHFSCTITMEGLPWWLLHGWEDGGQDCWKDLLRLRQSLWYMWGQVLHSHWSHDNPVFQTPPPLPTRTSIKTTTTGSCLGFGNILFPAIRSAQLNSQDQTVGSVKVCGITSPKSWVLKRRVTLGQKGRTFFYLGTCPEACSSHQNKSSVHMR